MRRRKYLLRLAVVACMKTLLLSILLLAGAARASEPVQVMILGTFHLANPGLDIHNQKVDDMLSPRRQAEIEAVTRALLRFAPTRVAVESSPKSAAERYAKYQEGTLAPSADETVQLGFRLAKQAKAAVEGIDVEGEFPFEQVAAWAAAHGRGAELDAISAMVEQMVREQSQALASGGVGGELRLLNDPAKIDNGFYRKMLLYGAGGEQPGANLLTAWYRRNFLICANLAQGVKPGDRVVVLYGSGHSFLLRDCAREMPGWKLVEAIDYLPPALAQRINP